MGAAAEASLRVDNGDLEVVTIVVVVDLAKVTSFCSDLGGSCFFGVSFDLARTGVASADRRPLPIAGFAMAGSDIDG